jgi:hypothetical protein
MEKIMKALNKLVFAGAFACVAVTSVSAMDRGVLYTAPDISSDMVSTFRACSQSFISELFEIECYDYRDTFLSPKILKLPGQLQGSMSSSISRDATSVISSIMIKNPEAFKEILKSIADNACKSKPDREFIPERVTEEVNGSAILQVFLKSHDIEDSDEIRKSIAEFVTERLNFSFRRFDDLLSEIISFKEGFNRVVDQLPIFFGGMVISSSSSSSSSMENNHSVPCQINPDLTITINSPNWFNSLMEAFKNIEQRKKSIDKYNEGIRKMQLRREMDRQIPNDERVLTQSMESLFTSKKSIADKNE